MWFLIFLVLMVASDPGQVGGVFYSTGKAPGFPDQPVYWYLNIAGRERPTFAGPFVNEAQARKAEQLHARGELTDDAFHVDWQRSPHGTGWWAFRRRSVNGPFESKAAAEQWVALESGA